MEKWEYCTVHIVGGIAKLTGLVAVYGGETNPIKIFEYKTGLELKSQIAGNVVKVDNNSFDSDSGRFIALTLIISVLGHDGWEVAYIEKSLSYMAMLKRKMSV